MQRKPTSFKASELPGPYNEYWVSDDNKNTANNAYRFRIDNAITDPSKKKMYFQKYV